MTTASTSSPSSNAIALWQGGESESAISVLKDHLEADPGDCLAWSDLGVLLFTHGKYAESERSFAKALEGEPVLPAALRGRGEALIRLKRYSTAVEFLARYLEVDPDNLGAILSLAECLAAVGRIDAGSRLVEFCLNAGSGSTRLFMLAAWMFQRQRMPGRVLAAVSQAVSLDPHDVELRTHLAFAYWDFGKMEDALRERDAVHSMNLSPLDLRISLSWLSLHDPNQTASGLLQIHRDNCGVSRKAAWSGELEPLHGRPLRIGYLSGEFIGGAGFCFIASFLRYMDHSRFHATFYSSRTGEAAKTNAYKGMADQWRDIWNVPDDDLAALIRQDRIDILVDFSGHYEGNRLQVFARHPAPIQIAIPNYPSTTGLEQMDYVLTDEWTTPPGSEDEYVETPYRLPSGYLMYEPLVEPPPVRPLPALSNGFITFGLFQRPSKYNDRFWKLAGEILREEAKAKLLIHFASADLDVAGSEQRQFLEDAAARHGITPDRVRFVGARPEAEHLETVTEADIALDSFPYNGQTTTCDSLWMGVPVVTLRGHTHVSRIASSLLIRMGLPQFVAYCEDEYVGAARRACSDVAALAQLRDGLRKRAQEHVGDGPRLARETGDAYRWIWNRACTVEAEPRIT